MSESLVKAAAERLKAAVAPCPVGKGSFPGVLCGDVLEVAGAVTEPDEVVAALVKGATGCMNQRGSSKTRIVHQNADHLRHLLERAGVT